MISLRFHIESPVTKNIGFSGPPLRAAFLEKVRDYHDELSEELHGESGVRQYAIDPLPSQQGFDTILEMGEQYVFGVNIFQSDGIRDFVRRLMDMDEIQFRIYENRLPIRRMDVIMCNPQNLMHEWVDCPSVLAARKARIIMQFKTPTQLSHAKSDALCLFPMPEKVFPSLLNTWLSIDRVNSLFPVHEYRKWVYSNLHVTRHHVRTRLLRLSPKLRVIGFTGRVDYVINDMKTLMSRMTVGLSRFSELCNVGKHRSAGLGKVSTRVLLMESENGSREWKEFSPCWDETRLI